MSDIQITEPEGVLILDKPSGITSHDCVFKMRKLFHTKKVGHTGTLDPMATGVLPVLFGRAAKAAEFLVAEEKHYIAGLRLGLTTDTEDTTGTVLTSTAVIPEEEAVRATIQTFLGETMQIPPMYSALKVNGEKLCDLARRGITVERQPRPVTIRQCNVTHLSDTDYMLDVICSKGTYIRTLCADIGAKLGCGGAMFSLRRAGTGSYTLSDAHTLTELEAMTDAERLSLLIPTESLFAEYPALVLPSFYERLCDNGNEIYLSRIKSALPRDMQMIAEGDYFRIYGEKKGFFALGQVALFETANGMEKAVKAVRKFVL